jgi:ABC-type transport system involved in multi-copper enzyme maturation permease subunit
MRGAIIGWGVGLLLYSLMMAFFYSSLETMEGYTEMLENFPPEMLAFFPSIYEIMTPQGYMDTYFFSYMTLIVGIFAVSVGANLLVGDEEKGILDLLASYPVSRSGFFWGRLCGLLVATAVILLISWLGWVIPAQSSGLNLSAFELLRPFAPLFIVLALFAGLALLFSMLMPSVRSAAGLAGALLVVNFLFLGLANINQDLQPIYELTPLYFYQGGSAVAGLDWANFLGLTAVTLVLDLLAWWLYVRREIRVGGESGWRLPRLAVLGKSS